MPTLDVERFYDITNVAPLFGEGFIVQVRSHNSAGYSPLDRGCHVHDTNVDYHINLEGERRAATAPGSVDPGGFRVGLVGSG